MNLKIKAYGIARDIFGEGEVDFKLTGENKVKNLKDELTRIYPDFEKLSSFSVAVNQEYQEDNFVLSHQDEIAIIPPVSGG